VNRSSRFFCFVVCTLLVLCTSRLLAQDWAKAKLEQSSRHREYVPVKHDGRTITTLVVYPEGKDKAPVVVLIHEVFGLSDWMKLQADELAAQGYIVGVPDLVSGLGTNGGGTDALGGQDNVIKAVAGLDPAQVNADLDAVADYGESLPSANGKLFAAGFCWGGGKAFAFATHRKDLSAAFVFYGPPPAAADMVKITAPVYGFYGGNDNRIGATVPQAIADMKAAGKFYEPVTYEDAGHGFMRAGQAPEAKAADKKAFDEGFARLLKELKASSTGEGSKQTRVEGTRRSAVVTPATAERPAADCAAIHGTM
jgi:carboxymethylenebutenolidase